MSPAVGVVVLAHDAPGRTADLVRRVRELCPDAPVLVRWDPRTTPTAVVRPLVAAAGGEVVEGVAPVRWGSWTLVEAALEGQQALAARHDPAWTVVVSGQDWPTAALPAWLEGLAQARRDGVHLIVDAAPLPSGPLSRRLDADGWVRRRYELRWYHLPRARWLSRLPGRLAGRTANLWFGTLGSVRLPVQLLRLPRGLGWVVGVPHAGRGATAVWKGQQWHAVSRDGLARLLAARDDPRTVARWRRALVPDEAFVPTVLLGGDDPVGVRRQAVSWTAFEGDAAHPRDLDPDAARLAVASGAPFARKLSGPDDVVATVQAVLGQA